MTFLLASIYSLIAGIRYQRILLWTLVIMAFVNSTHETDQAWGVYHYFINAKYFAELGYYDLYECTILEPVQRRDLRSYDFRSDGPTCNATFTNNRYKMFKQDIQSIGFYDGILRDKGFNATPAWIALAQFLIAAGVTHFWFIDLLALLIALCVLLYYTDLQTVGYTALFILTFYGTVDRLWGHFGQWLWLACVLIAIGQLHKNKSIGAIWLGFASALAIFPAVLMLRYWRNKQAIRYFLLGLSALLFIGLFNSRGLNAYFQFASKMKTHSRYINTELCCNIGLQQEITWTANPSLDYVNCFASYSDCHKRYAPEVPRGYYLMLAPFALLANTLGAMYASLTLSRYYYLILAVTPTWYGIKQARKLLFVNSLITLWMILDNRTGFILSGWLWFIYFASDGIVRIYHVSKTIYNRYYQI